ncbi:MAG: ATP synthase F1 subunit epsilon [Acidimicrobiia bacterium]|nr:ATP synthase F1 subunit epsilon [Acidimicrobiia bacterium]
MTLTVDLVSPEAVLYEGEAAMVVARTTSGGDIAFQQGHQPFLGGLGTWPVRLILDDGGEVRFAVHGGFVEVSGDRVIVLSDVAEVAEGIDVERARVAKAAAEEALRSDPDNEIAAAALARAQVRLEVAGAS